LAKGRNQPAKFGEIRSSSRICCQIWQKAENDPTNLAIVCNVSFDDSKYVFTSLFRYYAMYYYVLCFCQCKMMHVSYYLLCCILFVFFPSVSICFYNFTVIYGVYKYIGGSVSYIRCVCIVINCKIVSCA